MIKTVTQFGLIVLILSCTALAWNSRKGVAEVAHEESWPSLSAGATNGSTQAQISESIKVIVHPRNEISKLDRSDLARIYLGKKTLWDSGVRIVPILLTEENPITHFFVEEVLAKTVREYQSYWRQRLYSGGGTPPLTFRTSAEMLDFAAKNPGTIGIVESSAHDEGVKVIALP